MSKADELKAKNENLFERNTILLNENERLKKENAELKDDNKVMADNYSKMEQKFYDNLTKAKELLERLVTVCKIVPLGTNYNVVKQAEQFLKEIEE